MACFSPRCHVGKTTVNEASSGVGLILIELLIVVVILGILAAVIIPNVSSFVKKGQITAANAELAQVGTAGQVLAANGIGGLMTSWTAATPPVGTLIPAGFTTAFSVAAKAELAKYVQGVLKGNYYLNADGSIDMSTALQIPTYPGSITFNTTTKQFN